jgi:hypothetical protein
MHKYYSGTIFFKFVVFLSLFLMFFWWRYIVQESTLESPHPSKVKIV